MPVAGRHRQPKLVGTATPPSQPGRATTGAQAGVGCQLTNGASRGSRRARTAYAFLLFYGTALPWLAAHLYMTYDSAVAITRRFANAGARPGG